MSIRTFTAIVDGQTYEIPTSMAILCEAEAVSGVSLLESVAEDKLGGILQGVITVWLKKSGVKHNGEDVTFEIVGNELCNFAETQANYISFFTAMLPEVKSSKNAKKRSSKSSSAGVSSSDMATDSSS